MTDTAIRPAVTREAVEAAEGQQAAAAQAVSAAALLATRLAADGASREEIVANARFQQLVRSAAQQILSANAARRVAGDDEPIREHIERLEPELTSKIQDGLVEAVFSRTERLEEDDVDMPEEQERWADNAGNSLSTQLVADASVELAKPVEEHLGTKLKKLWMSRGDSKVRGSHRKLHGSTAELDKPFWRELGTGRALRYPGDPAAPIEQTINCRCWLWFVPEDQAAEAEKTFQMPESDFELIAASGHAHGSLDDLDPAIIDAAIDVEMGLIAAAVSESERQRRFEESSHKRDVTGKFAQKPKAQTEEGYADRVRRGRELQERYRSRRGEERRVGGKGGGSEKDAAKAAKREALRKAREALQVKQEAEREELRVKQEAEREALTVEQEAEDTALSRKREAELEAQRLVREKLVNERQSNVEKQLARRRMEDAAKRGERLSEDEALLEIAEEVKEIERQTREKQRDADRLIDDMERSREYIRQMRIRGEEVGVIDAERTRLLGLEDNHKKILGDVEDLQELSRAHGTSDTVRKLRDRVRLNRRAEDDKLRTQREQFDAAIRVKSQQQDASLRSKDTAIRERLKSEGRQQSTEQRQERRAQTALQRERRRAQSAAQRAARNALRSAGEPSSSCIICLLPSGDREITYNDGSTAPMHMTLGYMGDAAQYDDTDVEMFSTAIGEIADLIPPFTGKVAGQATLGENSDTVTLIEAPEIARARDYVMSDDELSYAIGQADEHPNWIPHVTGLADVKYQDDVEFDRLGLWVGEDRQEYSLNG